MIMKRYIFSVAIIVMMLWSGDVYAKDNNAHNDSIAATLRMNTLRSNRERLQKEIKIQDAKRNKQIAGVSPETLEEMNERQDSICLSLRSELVDVMLEIQEVTPSVTTPQLVNQYNNLINRKNEAQPDSIQTSIPAQSSASAGGKR